MGIDTSKSKHSACFVSSSGKYISKAFNFDNASGSIEALREAIVHYREELGGGEVICGVESTGNYHKVLAHYLEERGFKVVLVSTLAVKRNRKKRG